MIRRAVAIALASAALTAPVLGARGESPAAFDGRCIPRLGATRHFHYGLLAAQMRAPRAELTPTVETTRVRAGKPATLLLKVVLPPAIHVQSDKPRDPAFFPTVLKLAPPPGVSVASTTYPPAVDFTQEGQPAPLAVFEKTFTVSVKVDVAASVTPGPLVVPGRFDYQACDERVCYRPVKTDVQWTLTVAP